MKMTTNRVFSARHRVSLPISIIVERVQFIVTNMKLHGVQLSESDFLALVDLYARARNIGAMEASFRDFALAYPDSYLSIEAANSVLSGYVGAHRVQDAARWYDSMVTKFALRPNHFTYSLLMAMYGRTGDSRRSNAFSSQPAVLFLHFLKHHRQMTRRRIPSYPTASSLLPSHGQYLYLLPCYRHIYMQL
ncbi:hypothetical protein BCR44DRAFT_1226545 [Catenaria anguillulae PL171]|uniref:Pentacotripeptide-repeat region of PRORP domain-containing protein n=1 Tax=Catenaria anguillulae PL171 TaxID=765915 RepID=A0A1Y2HE57_9FUNG|nr:hypothetical protein BCR44DRAFT_1226545 [Catenaria anguillulae PL171]